MSKELLQKIKDEYAKEKGYPRWDEFLDDEDKVYPCDVEGAYDEKIIPRYAAAVTNELKAENEQMKSDIVELRTVIYMIYVGVDTTDYLENKMALILEKTKHY